jgi:lipoyl-dependent peroxiredoxin subunit D
VSLAQVRDALPDAARDIKVNLGNVLSQGTLAPEQRAGVALAAALAAKAPALARAIADETRISPEIRADAEVAAALMAMTNVLYRFKHLVGKAEYQDLPARLRMMRLGQPASSKTNLELFSLAVSALAGCETCIQSHERVLVEHGLTPEQIFEAVRVAATVNAAATALLF